MLLIILLSIIALALVVYRKFPRPPEIIHRETGKKLYFVPIWEFFCFMLGLKKTIYDDQNMALDIHDDMFGLFFMGKYYIYVTKPDDLKKFMNNTELVKDIGMPREFMNIYNNSLLFVHDKPDNPQWSNQKKIIKLSFKRHEIDTNIQPIFCEVAEHFMDHIAKHDSEIIDMESWIERFTFDVIGKGFYC